MRLFEHLVVAALVAGFASCAASSAERAPSVAGPRWTPSRRAESLSTGERESRPMLAAPAARARFARATVEEAGAARRSAPPATTQAAPERAIVRSAYLRIQRKDPENGVKAAVEIAGRLGGWVQRSDIRSATIMIPAERLDEALEALAGLGKVARKDVRGEDVTEEYLDLRIRLENLERARQRYAELLAKAQTVEETLKVERELERITVDIERLKGRIGYLERMVRHSTIDLVFERPVGPGPVGWIFYILYHGVKWLFVWD